jgi:hypothetical protein
MKFENSFSDKDIMQIGGIVFLKKLGETHIHKKRFMSKC